MIDFSNSPFEAERLCAGCSHVRFFEPDTLSCMHPNVAVPSVVQPALKIGVNVICVRPKQCQGDWFEAAPK